MDNNIKQVRQQKGKSLYWLAKIPGWHTATCGM